MVRICPGVPVSTRLAQSVCIAAAVAVCLAGQASAAWPGDYDPRYVQAVENTSGTVPNEVVRESNHLAHLGDSRMEWSGDRLIMTMLTDFAGYDRYYSDSRYRPEVWVAPVGETVEFFRAKAGQADDLELRYRQYMGMPAGHSDDRIVELLVHPDMLFRPAEDTRIESASLGPGRDTTQYEKASVAYPTFDQWWANQMHTYDGDSNPPYPWTRLGYTYDWGGSPDEVVGSTEFIVKRWGTGTTWLRDAVGDWYQASFSVPGAEYAVTVHAVVPTTAYPYYVRSGPEVGNFYVSGDCKTIWAGDRFTPVGSDAPVVDVAAGAAVGNGILIDDAGIGRTFRLTNRGSILGGLYGPDKAVRDRTIEFRSPVRFDNSGLVDAPLIAVCAETASGAAFVENSGTLRAGQYAALLSAFDDTLVNWGFVDGDVDMGGGDDTAVLAGGEIRGDVDGGTHGTGDLLLVQAEGPAAVTGEIRGFEQTVVSRSSGSGDGAFVLNGTLFGNVLVGASGGDYVPGKLAGNFAIDGNLSTEQGARIAPGNSLGAGLIAGDYTQSAGAVLEVEIARTAADQLVSDRLTVTGTALLADGAGVYVLREASQSGLPLRVGDSFDILEAGLLDLAAAPLCESGSDLLSFECAGSGNQLLLIVADARAFADLAVGDRNRAIAGALDADLAGAGGVYGGMLAELQFAGAAGLNETLDSIRPDAYQVFDRAVRLVTFSMHEQLAERAAPSCGGAAPMQRSASAGDDSPAGPSGETRFAVEPFGLVHYEGTSLVTSGCTAESAGFLLSADRQIGDRLVAGVVFGYAGIGTDLADHSGHANVDLYRVGPYAALSGESWRLHGAATFGRHDYDAARSAGSLGGYDAAYSASDGSIYFDARRVVSSAGWVLSPVASMQYTFGGRGAFSEDSSGPAAMAFAPWDSDSLRWRLGAGIGRTIGFRRFTVCPAILAGWAHECLSDERTEARFSSGDSLFRMPSDVFLQNAGFLRAAVSVCGPGRLETAFAYNGQWGEQTAAHWGSLSVATRF